MKTISLILCLVLFISCQKECPGDCLYVYGSTTFELHEEADKNLNYYLSFNTDDQGIVNLQLPSSGKINIGVPLECQRWHIFATEKTSTQEVHQDINLFYQYYIDTQFVYWCDGLVGCN